LRLLHVQYSLAIESRALAQGWTGQVYSKSGGFLHGIFVLSMEVAGVLAESGTV